MGIAGVDSEGIHTKARLGIAGNLSSTIRPTLDRATAGDDGGGALGLGDIIERESWRRACYLLNANYLVYYDPKTDTVVWREWAYDRFARGNRNLPVFADSTGFPRSTGNAPKWLTREIYLRCVDVIDPEKFVLFDEIGNMKATLANYEYTRAMGYGDKCIPVWQIAATWDDHAGALLGRQMPTASEAVRTAIANARITVRDPIFQYLASKSQLIAIGGMAHGPCPREVRHVFFAELCRLCPDHQFWGLGQASAPVVNGLGPEGLLDRVWLDGSWWIHNARTENLPILQDGLIKSLRLEKKGRTFFKFGAKLTANICSLLGAYDNRWNWPPPAPTPVEMDDLDAVLELRRRLERPQMDLWQLLGANFDKPATGEESAD